ncbi:hyaluronidase-3 isoform X1 [Alligator sinensis]|uniref:Hyaluronidase n=1 Tax=Alligator sinensis TaxID=38654 RepID=A0A1U8D2F5_ALLSI|nr:hyaluronidase-3 isoform X1 [Alligator sinensis]
MALGTHSETQQEGPQASHNHRASTMTVVLIFWICVMRCIGAGQSLRGHGWERPSPDPIVQDKPFVVVWNMPTTKCQQRFGVALPLGDYGIVENQGNEFQGQNMTIFYKNKFGLYPYISQEGKPYHGGIPQKVHLKRHLEQASLKICELMHQDFHGLAVVDWEEWRPLWVRNWGTKRLYRETSVQWVWERFPELPVKKRALLAEVEFEEAAQVLMERTLTLGKALRPGGFWGFYGFPNCFNNNWEKEDNYTGKCSLLEMARNNQLTWLWEVSTALYPSIYLPPKLPESERRRYVHHRLLEAFRVARFNLEWSLPVIAYSRVSYRLSPKYLSEADLVNTIGESAALGVAGVVLWGDSSYSHLADSCKSLHDYITSTLGPYVMNVTTAAQQCSRQLCHGHGRCVRQHPQELGAFLHLDPEQQAEEPVLTNHLSMDQLGHGVWQLFQCHCYHRWTGANCEKQVWTEPVRNPLSILPSQSQDVCVTGQDGNTLPSSEDCTNFAYNEKTDL